MRPAEVFRCPQCLVSCDRTGGDGLPRLGILVRWDDCLGTAIGDRVVTLSGIVGVVRGDAADRFVNWYLAEQIGQHRASPTWLPVISVISPLGRFAWQIAFRAMGGRFNGAIIGDPEATVPAILKVVDAEEPPLRLILGNWLLPMVKQHHRSRIETWEKWADVSNAAQGAANT